MSTSAATEQIIFDEMMRVRKHGKYSPHESNYTRLFGTPERAAQTLADNCDDYNLCDGCPADCASHDCYDALLEWMRGDA